MPYTRAYNRYRSRARKTRTMGGIRRGFRGTRRRPMTVGKVKRIISAELKSKIISQADVAIMSGASGLIHLTDIAVGDNADERDGNRIQPVNVHGHLTLVGDTAGQSVNDVVGVRCIIVRWLEDQSQTAASDNFIMEDDTKPAGPFNITNKGMFKILWSRYFTIVNTAENPAFRKTLRYYVKLSRGQKTLYDGATFKKFHLFMLVITDSGAMDDLTYSLDNTFRFTDS